MDSYVKQNLLNRVMGAMACPSSEDGNPLRWFFCFGTLLHYIRTRDFTVGQDVDIGVIYDECDSEKMLNIMLGLPGYEVDFVLRNDINGKPLNINLIPNFDALEFTPSLDIYFWYPVGDMYYHTYDVNKERRETPSKYILKGVRKEWLRPDQDTIKRIRKSGPETDRQMDEKGVWHYDIFGDHSGYTFPVPYKYGTLLDEWYPNWLIPDRNFGQSKSTWVKEVKSMKKVGKI